MIFANGRSRDGSRSIPPLAPRSANENNNLQVNTFCKLVLIKDKVGAFDLCFLVEDGSVTAAQCRGLSYEIKAKCASHNKMAPKPEIAHGITIDTHGRFETTRIVCVLLIVERNKVIHVFEYLK